MIITYEPNFLLTDYSQVLIWELFVFKLGTVQTTIQRREIIQKSKMSSSSFILRPYFSSEEDRDVALDSSSVMLPNHVKVQCCTDNVKSNINSILNSKLLVNIYRQVVVLGRNSITGLDKACKFVQYLSRSHAEIICRKNVLFLRPSIKMKVIFFYIIIII